MGTRTKNTLLATGSLIAITVSALWIYYREFRAPKHNVILHERIGEVMAEQTAKLAGRKAKLVLLTIPDTDLPELKTQLDAFRRTLKKLGNYEIKTHEFDTKDQAKYSLGAGLSGRRFVRAVKNNPTADAIVSFIGAPGLSDADLAELSKAPKFIAEARTPDHLSKLFEKKLIQVAVVSRFVFPAPGPSKPKTPEQWFNNRYQVLLAEQARDIPLSNAE